MVEQTQVVVILKGEAVVASCFHTLSKSIHGLEESFADSLSSSRERLCYSHGYESLRGRRPHQQYTLTHPRFYPFPHSSSCTGGLTAA